MTENRRQMTEDRQQVPYRQVNNWILAAYEWLNGSLVNLDKMVNMVNWPRLFG
jgi:hypothetical protein